MIHWKLLFQGPPQDVAADLKELFDTIPITEMDGPSIKEFPPKKEAVTNYIIEYGGTIVEFSSPNHSKESINTRLNSLGYNMKKAA